MNSIDGWLANLDQLRGPATAAVRIALILAGTRTAQVVANRLIRTFRARISARTKGTEEIRRAETLGRVFRYVATAFIGLVGGVLVLAECGVSVAPILGAAGVVGLAVGFGAQSRVKDYFTSIFLLVENLLRGRFKVRPLEQWNVRRVYLRRLKGAFDAACIEIPFPHVTLYAGIDKDGLAPAFHVVATDS